MIHVIIPFEVKPEAVNEAVALITEFVSQVKANESGTLTYRSFQDGDVASRFVHVMSFADKASQDDHRNSAYCQHFVERLYPLCTLVPDSKVYRLVAGTSA